VAVYSRKLIRIPVSSSIDRLTIAGLVRDSRCEQRGMRKACCKCHRTYLGERITPENVEAYNRFLAEHCPAADGAPAPARPRPCGRHGRLNRKPELSDETILSAVEVGCTLYELFRNKWTIDGRAKMLPHGSCGVVTLAGRTRGTHRLAGGAPFELLIQNSQMAGARDRIHRAIARRSRQPERGPLAPLK
jgi:hypothetical protein